MVKVLNKCLFCIIVFLVLGIICKSNSNYKDIVKNILYEDSISFTKFSNFYNKYLGGIFPIEGIFDEKTMKVFNETLVYNSSIPYYDGLMLDVGNNYLIPSMDEGIVVYIGEKEKYGNVVIIENVEGVNVWYGNMCNINVSLYDYVSSGYLLGESCDNYLYLLYNKDNKFLNYNDFLNG